MSRGEGDLVARGEDLGEVDEEVGNLEVFERSYEEGEKLSAYLHNDSH
jgi:hypothetical protein